MKISIVKNIYDRKPQVIDIPYDEFIKKISTPIKTNETYFEYQKLTKAEKNKIKDVGGFIGGYFTSGGRSGEVIRTILTLDIDEAEPSIIDVLKKLPFKTIIYSTRNHTTEKPRYRVIIPFTREVGFKEYPIVAAKFLEKYNIPVDPVSEKSNQIMFFPSCSSDKNVFYHFNNGNNLDPDVFLNNKTSNNKEDLITEAKEQIQDANYIISPLEKTGVIGRFCRQFNIHDVITRFLSDVYEKAEENNRYTYIDGTTSGGLVVYDNGLFAYSNHSTDPAYHKKLNSFDLVRVHLFQEENSFDNMLSFAKQALGEIPIVSDDDRELSHRMKGTRTELINILKYDKNLEGVWFDTLQQEYVVKEGYTVPWKRKKEQWTVADDANLRSYIEKEYCIENLKNLNEAMLSFLCTEKLYNPIEEYFDSLEWDGVKRLETLFVDYLGAEDNEYTRDITRKCFTAAVARTYNPGTKFDNMLILIGEQGKGKSTIFSKMGGKYFTDALSISDMNDKQGPEKTFGKLIAEISEMQGTNAVATIKAFVSKTEDRYRPPYQTKAETFPRTFILVGTTNEKGFLKDPTGNRRFWPLYLPNTPSLDLWKLKKETIDQIWAEAVFYFAKGEKLYLDGKALTYSKVVQLKALESDEDIDEIIKSYISMPLPSNWKALEIRQRYLYFLGYLNGEHENVSETYHKRTFICAQEVMYEALGCDFEGYRSPVKSQAIKTSLKKLGCVPNPKKHRFDIYGPQITFDVPNNLTAKGE